MRGALRFLFLLTVALAGLTWAAMQVVRETTREWFERDVALRAELAVSGLRRTIQDPWSRGDVRAVEEQLQDVTQDERVTAAAACAGDGTLVAQTPGFPRELGCASLSRRRSEPVAPTRWVQQLASGRAHVSLLPVPGDPRGRFIVLLQDLGFAERRSEMARHYLLLAFGILTVCASVVTVAAARLSWRGWSNELRKVLRTGAHRSEFQPVLQDVRELVERLSSEREIDGHGGVWTPQRLRQVLRRHLQGERLVVVANREPYIHERSPQGTRVVHPASGLVTALEPVMRACSGVWVAHGSGSADRETVDRAARVRVPPHDPSYMLRRVWLASEEERGYYYGLANEGIWPLCHMAHTRPNFRIEDWHHYEAVNLRFAEAACEEIDSEDPIVWVQDYHFALAPYLIRERLPKATILAFWHIPWPHAERFGMCPWRKEILEGLLGSSILGFQTQLHSNNFIDSVDRFLEARIDRETSSVVHHGRSTLVRPYPISVEWPSRLASETPAAATCRSGVLADLGLSSNALLGVGVDRLDYTKGIEERLLAVERLLERFPSFVGRFTFVQLAAPSRMAIDRYRRFNEDVERLADRINGRFGAGGYLPIVLLRAHHEPPTVHRFYRAADVCFVSSLHDGMNLVAKEFVAARDDERGVLVLSQFTGAARELTEALIVNPYDLEESSSALATALTMPALEQADRMRFMRSVVAEFNVYRWAGRMLVDAARLRRRQRLSGRITDRLLGMDGVA